MSMWEIGVLVFVSLGSAWGAWHVRGWWERVRRHWRRRRRPRRTRRARKRTQRRSVFKMSPKEFEQVCAQLMEAWGYRTEVVGGSGDGGVDIRGWKDGRYVIAQCKRYKRSVPASLVREFYGVMVREKADKGFFFTTGRVSEALHREAAEFTRNGYPIAIVDGEELDAYLQANELPSPWKRKPHVS